MQRTHSLYGLIPMLGVGLLAAPSALAQAAEPAGLNHELWWLALALLVGFSVVARRASHHEPDSNVVSGPEAAEAAAAQTPMRERLRLINKPEPEPRVETPQQPSLDMPPKKTA